MKAVVKGYLYLSKQNIPGIQRLRDSLCARSRYDRQYCVYAFEETSTSIGIPLNFNPSLYSRIDKLHDLRTVGKTFAIDLQTQLWDYQQNAFDEIKSAVLSGKTNFIVKARTGWGKTVLASAIVNYFKTTTLIVVPVTTLVQQWKAELLKHTTLTEDDIGVATDAQVDWRGKKIVIGLVHTLVLDRWGEEFKKNFGLLFLDEVDRSASPETFSPVCTLFPAKYRFAASATTERKDGLDKIFRWHFGEVYIDGNKYKNIKVHRAKVLAVKYPHANIPLYVSRIRDKLKRRGATLSALANDQDRNRMLCTYIKKFYNTKRPTVVLSDRIDQLISMATIMEQEYKVPINDIGFFVRSMPNSLTFRRTPQNQLPEKLIIFGTYKMLDIGFDMKPLSGLVLATPRSAIEQTVGRIERFMEGKQQPIVFDPVDVSVKDALDWWRARQKEYNRLGIPITERGHQCQKKKG